MTTSSQSCGWSSHHMCKVSWHEFIDCDKIIYVHIGIFWVAVCVSKKFISAWHNVRIERILSDQLRDPQLWVVWHKFFGIQRPHSPYRFGDLRNNSGAGSKLNPKIKSCRSTKPCFVTQFIILTVLHAKELLRAFASPHCTFTKLCAFYIASTTDLSTLAEYKLQNYPRVWVYSNR